MAEYLHGVYGESQSSNYTSATAIGTLPVYIGTLPIQRLNTKKAKGFDYSAYVNKPILLESYKDVASLGIYSDDWETYTLEEAIHAHFMNGDSVGPVVLINMLNPKTHINNSQTSSVITLSKEGKSYVGYVEDPLCCIDDIAITGESVTFNEGEVEYKYDGDTIKIIITKNDLSVDSVTVAYKPIKFTTTDITEEDFTNAVNSVEDVEPVTGLLPTILTAPKFSSKPEHHDIMIQKAIEKAGRKWNIICVTDIPATKSVETYQKAIEWKKTNQYNSKLEKVCWLSGGNGDKIYCGSTLWTFAMQMTDFNNGGTPHKSPSNEMINIDRTVLEDGTVIFLKEYQANEMNKVGISTFNLVKRQFRTWGAHMGNYDFSKLDLSVLNSIKPEDRFDAQIRMNHYILNYLQYHYISEIDQSFKKSDIDSIVNSVQAWLDGLVNEGKLLYAKVNFDTASNPIEQIENGDLIFDFEVTYAITAKSITFRLQYTRAGIVALLEGGESNE